MSWIGRALGWLEGVPRDLSHLASDVWKAVHGALTFVDGIFHLVGAGWDDLFNEVRAAAAGMAHLLRMVGDHLWWLITWWIPHAVEWVDHRVVGVATEAWSWVEGVDATVAHDAARAWDDLQAGLRFVQRDLLGPAERDLSGVLGWVEHGAADAVDLVLHPDRLLGYLAAGWAQLWRTALPGVAAPITRWLFGGHGQDLWAFAQELERVLSDVI